jgi:hypothetical protein
MPLLTDEEQKRMHAVKYGDCDLCKQPLGKNYCRSCDEFFTCGHLADCEKAEKEHREHRTY